MWIWLKVSVYFSEVSGMHQWHTCRKFNHKTDPCCSQQQNLRLEKQSISIDSDRQWSLIYLAPKWRTYLSLNHHEPFWEDQILTDNQHGFWRKLARQTQLIATVHLTRGQMMPLSWASWKPLRKFHNSDQRESSMCWWNVLNYQRQSSTVGFLGAVLGLLLFLTYKWHHKRCQFTSQTFCRRCRIYHWMTQLWIHRKTRRHTLENGEKSDRCRSTLNMHHHQCFAQRKRLSIFMDTI